MELLESGKDDDGEFVTEDQDDNEQTEDIFEEIYVDVQGKQGVRKKLFKVNPVLKCANSKKGMPIS